jgi:hypothetical protein
MDVNADRIFAGKSMSSWMAAFARREVVDELKRILDNPGFVLAAIETRIAEIEKESEGA